MNSIRLTNWRCFSDYKFAITSDRLIITDSNGSGKTSIISSIFTLLTNSAWPGTTLRQSIRHDQEYFNLFADKHWYTSALLENGRLRKKSKTDSRPDLKPITYTPDDNWWLTFSRTKKLQILDEMISQIHPEHRTNIRQLTKAVTNKSAYIRNLRDAKTRFDQTLVTTLGNNIHQLSHPVWELRREFLNLINERVLEFMAWVDIGTPSLHYEVANDSGDRMELVFKNDNNAEGSTPNWQKLWEREYASGKVLYGAQRDDFQILINNNNAADVLSRGEMRSLVIFVKKLVREQIDSDVIWLLDDVFNELDNERENLIFDELILPNDKMIATATRQVELNNEVEYKSVEEMKI